MTFTAFYIHLIGHVLAEISQQKADQTARKEELLDSSYGELSDFDYPYYSSLFLGIKEDKERLRFFGDFQEGLIRRDVSAEDLKAHPARLRDLFDFAREDDWTDSVEADVVRQHDGDLLSAGLADLRRLISEI